MTGYGFVGPMTAQGTVFDAKEEFDGGGASPSQLMLLGAGSLFLALCLSR